MKHILYLILFSCLYIPYTFADSFYCSNSSQHINIGDDMQTVVAKCGAPVSKTKRVEKIMEPVRIFKWLYRFDVTSKPPSRPPLVVNFVNGKVRDIEIQGEKVQETTMCNVFGPSTIKVGDSQQRVSQACSTASYETTVIEQREKGKKTIDVWIYQFDQYQPPTVLEFEKGVLTAINPGKE